MIYIQLLDVPVSPSRTNDDLVRFLRTHRGSNFVKTHGGDIRKLVKRRDFKSCVLIHTFLESFCSDSREGFGECSMPDCLHNYEPQCVAAITILVNSCSGITNSEIGRSVTSVAIDVPHVCVHVL